MGIYDFSAERINGKEVSLEQYKGQVLIVVNTASECGFTPQYEDLQKLYDRYKDKGLNILGFPCNQFGGQEPGQNEEVETFCQLNYGVSFPLFNKVDVRGSQAHPLFQYLTDQAPFTGLDNKPGGKMLQAMLQTEHPEFLIDDSIKWNFTKFLIDRDGNVVKRFESIEAPFEMERDIETLL
ncbi:MULTISPECIES: glutathione peroxidase [Peribacillus]|uniref:Glutathione peroxidase n=1 Tax=Peribacillus simplex TaxID=1478 RepID=A0A125QRN0_9BACI|nr:glutathione peroxidase [Peribacillus simplex]KWW16986.1 glutathione peroxidase [Peribacillus simplex]